MKSTRVFVCQSPVVVELMVMETRLHGHFTVAVLESFTGEQLGKDDLCVFDVGVGLSGVGQSSVSEPSDGVWEI